MNVRVTQTHVLEPNEATQELNTVTYQWLKSECSAHYAGVYTVTPDDQAQTVTLTKSEDATA